MSTNYYWTYERPDTIVLPTGVEIYPEVDNEMPEIHIGKRYKSKNGLGFIWAQEEDEVREALQSAECYRKLVVETSEGERITGQGMLEILDEITDHDHGSVGEYFS